MYPVGTKIEEFDALGSVEDYPPRPFGQRYTTYNLTFQPIDGNRSMNRAAYPTDLTDAQWERIKPLIPPAKWGGRPREGNLREILIQTSVQLSAVGFQLKPVLSKVEGIGISR